MMPVYKAGLFMAGLFLAMCAIVLGVLLS